MSTRNSYANLLQMSIALQQVVAAITVMESGDNVLQVVSQLHDSYQRRDDLIRVLTDEITCQYDRRATK